LLAESILNAKALMAMRESTTNSERLGVPDECSLKSRLPQACWVAGNHQFLLLHIIMMAE